MQLSLTLSALLSAVLVMLSMQVVESTPMQRSPKLATLPLKRLEQSSDVHPQIYLQQNINRSLRRLARMTGNVEPSKRALEQRLERRVLAVEGPQGLQRRFNRLGLPPVHPEKRDNRTGVHASVAASFRHMPYGNTANGGQGASASDGGQDTSASDGGQNTSASDGGQGASASDASLSTTSEPLTKAKAPTAGHSLGLDIEAQDVGYLATVQMGTPPRNFLLLMDSGSADLWVGGENCQSQVGGDCGNHNFLGKQSSSSFVDTGKPFSVTYGTGQVSGNIITDNMNVAGLALKSHKFGVATTESVDFTSADLDGLMGLAQSTLSEQKTPTPVESLASAGLIPDSIVSFKISRLADNKNDGEITFGALDPSKFDSNALVTVPNVNGKGFWEAAVDSSTVDGTDTGLTGKSAVLDTGTTLIIMPAADAAAIHNLINGAQADGQGGFTVPCTTKASVAFTFSGRKFAIDPRDIAFTPIDPNNPQGDCVSGIASGDIGGANEWLLGDVFLKNAYFSTDVSKNSITLAKLV